MDRIPVDAFRHLLFLIKPAKGAGGNPTTSTRKRRSLLKVRLESPNTGVLNTVTDSDGAFIFTNLEAGDYRLTVDGGPNFENVVEYPSIYREASPGGRIVRMAVHLRLRAPVDSDLTDVRKEALDHYRKGLEYYKRAADQLETYLKLMPKAADAEKTRVAIKDLRSRR